MVVPPDAALAAFVMGVLGWYGMIRTAIERFNNDIHEAKSGDTSVNIGLGDLELLDNDMERWRELWLILDKDMLEDLHVTLWGRQPYEKIRSKLKDMEKKAMEARDIVDTWIKMVKKEQMRLVEAAEARRHENENGLEEKVQKSFHRQRLMERAQKGLFRVEWFFAKKSHLKKVVKDMISQKNYVYQIAEDAWKKRGKTFDPNIIQNEGLWELLRPFVIQKRAELALMARSLVCLDNDFHVELELNPFERDQTIAVHPEEHRRSRQVPIILESAAKESIKVGFLIASSKRPHLPVRVVIAKCGPVNTTSAISAGNSNAYNAVDKLVRQEVQDMQEVYYQETQSDHFSVAKSTQFHEQNATQRSALRELLSGVTTLPNAGRENQVDRPAELLERALLDAYSKYKSVFELAQACFVFMQTSWLRNLCSCRLQCGELRDRSRGNYEYAVNINSALTHLPVDPHSVANPRIQSQADNANRQSHPAANTQIQTQAEKADGELRPASNEQIQPQADSANKQSEPLPPWCADPAFWNYTSSPLRRLGIVLIELTLEIPVRHVTMDARGVVTRVLLRSSGPEDGYDHHGLRTRIVTLTEEERDRDERPRNDQYANAILHCLMGELPEMSATGLVTGQDLEETLRKFYWKVVVP